jgi:hypothetical protein
MSSSQRKTRWADGEKRQTFSFVLFSFVGKRFRFGYRCEPCATWTRNESWYTDDDVERFILGFITNCVDETMIRLSLLHAFYNMYRN